MARSKSQRMTETREGKKEQHGDACLNRERERVKSCYTPIELLTGERSKSREKNGKNAKRFCSKHTKSHENDEEMHLSTSDSHIEHASEVPEDDNGVSSTSKSGDLKTVKMSFAIFEPRLYLYKKPRK